MAHTRGGGIGNMAGSDDRTIEELVTELRERVMMGGGQDDIYGDELERLATAIPVWRPIDEAPIPDHEHVPEYWLFPCLIQDRAGVVYAGFARYATTNARGRDRVLRWYEGVTQRYAKILHPRYFMPLPQPRKD